MQASRLLCFFVRNDQLTVLVFTFSHFLGCENKGVGQFLVALY